VGSTKAFLEDAAQHAIADKLDVNFRAHFGRSPGFSELRSWRNSLQAVALHLNYARLLDNGIILEMQLPLSSARLDCLLTGRDDQGRDQAVIVELKQWETAKSSEIDECVVTFLAGRDRDEPHPSVQVRNYETYLSDMHEAFYSPPMPVGLSSCSYLHNFTHDPASTLYDSKFATVLAHHPLFAKNQAEELSEYLRRRLAGSGGVDVLQRVIQSKYRPSKKLLDHVAGVIKGKTEYTLLDEQIVAFNKVVHYAKIGFHDAQKAVIIISGGPGTGKSLIAVNVMAALAEMGLNTQHATGSKAFTENLRKAVGGRASAIFKYFNSYSGAERGAIDVLICDEAHRIRKTSNSRFTAKEARSTRDQVDEIIDAAKVSVFLIDDKQVVRPDEIGSSEMIRQASAKFGARLIEERLQTQFRCAGSEAFVNWVDGWLEIGDSPQTVFESTDLFEFKIVDTPESLDSLILAKIAAGFTARLAAGFCWPWSAPNADGSLVDDVAIGDFRRPWNAKPDAGKLAIGIPQSSFWASDPNGADQIGCIYTAQGFEFDYVGVIVGRDLIYDATSGRWRGDLTASFDGAVKRRAKDRFIDFAKSAYRVLLTRGMKGCFIYFQDQATRDHVAGLVAKA
jgi:Mrp family chromosome partitioning ATPase